MDKIRRTLKRRRKEGKTDYRSRIEILKAGVPRLAVRKTNKYLIAEIIESDSAQDRIILGASSKELLKEGWPKEKAGSLKSKPASYLTGLILAKKSEKKIKCILDIGLQRNSARGRIYSLLKGVIDGGIEVAHSEKALPGEEEIVQNKELREIFNKLKEKLG